MTPGAGTVAMLPSDRLRDKLIIMNGKGVQVYRDLAGAYRFERFELYLDAIRPDPVAPTGLVRVRIDQAEAQVPRDLWESPSRRLAVQDFLGRAVREAIARHVRTRWSGRTPPLAIDAGGPEILARTSCTVAEDYVEIRLTVGLPAEGRKVQARPAQTLLFEELPAVVNAGLVWAHLDAVAGRRHCDTYEDYLALREALPSLGLVAFLADGSLLARESGPGDRPLRGGRAVPLRAPDELAVTVDLPHRGAVRGLGIPRGVTVIAGPSYSGKSTLLAAVGSGVYPHVPGDGREYVAALPDAVTIRAEPGRRIEHVDVSGFIRGLPPRLDPGALAVERASGALSMAAAVAEALEVGTGLILVDEDEGAVAFLVRDEVMRALAPGLDEPLVPLVDRMRALWEACGISCIIATGGLGDYLTVADTVILMDGYQPVDATERARSLAAGLPRRPPAPWPFALPAARIPLPRGLGGVRGRGLRAEVRGRDTLTIGRDSVDLGALPQLVDAGQARAAGDAILYAVEKGYIAGEATVGEVLDRVLADVDTTGLAVLAAQPEPQGEYAMPRRHEVAAVLNRLRSLQVRVKRAPAPQPAPGEAAAPAQAEETAEVSPGADRSGDERNGTG